MSRGPLGLDLPGLPPGAQVHQHGADTVTVVEWREQYIAEGVRVREASRMAIGCACGFVQFHDVPPRPEKGGT